MKNPIRSSVLDFAFMRCLLICLVMLLTAFGLKSETVSVCRAGPISDAEVQIWLDKRIGRQHECSKAIEEIAVVKLLAHEAQQLELDKDPVLARKLRMVDAAAWSDVAKLAIEAATPPPTVEEITALVAERGKFFEHPPRLRLRWIFRIAAADDETAQTKARNFLEGLRRRLVEGDLTFSEAARQYSQSESRYRDGLAGAIAASDVSPELADIVFALDVGEVSEVITSKTGQNLFLVETHFPARYSTDSEKRERARELLVIQKGERRWEDFREEIQRSADPQISLENLGAEDPDAVVLRLADGKKLTTAQTMDLVGIPAEKATNRLTKMAFLMSIPNAGLKLGWVLDDGLRMEYELRRARLLATETMSRIQDQETGPPTSKEIATEWRLDRPKYRSEDRYRLWRARFDLTKDDAISEAYRLRVALGESNTSPTSLEGVETDEVWLDRTDVLEMGSMAARAVRTADVSSVLGPFRNDKGFWLIRVIEHQAGEAQSLDLVSETIARDLETAAREAVSLRVYQERHAQADLKKVSEPSCSSTDRPENQRIAKPN